jgi:hypothetical protein
MRDIQEIFNRILEAKREKNSLQGTYKDAITNLAEYKDLTDQIATLQTKKKQIENALQQQFATELARLDEIKAHIKGDSQMLSDIALTMFMKGETVQIIDQQNRTYEPKFNVAFKKIE